MFSEENARQVLERSVRDGALVAPSHVECVNARQVHQRRIRDGDWLQPLISSV